MTKPDSSLLLRTLLDALPRDGSPAGNAKLRYGLVARFGREVSNEEYEAARDQLVKSGLALKGKGRGGTLLRAKPVGETDRSKDFALTAPDPVPPRPQSKSSQRKGPKREAGSAGAPKVLSYRHDQKRINNPEVGMVTPDSDPAVAETVWRYDAHIDPALQFDSGRAGLERLIDEALASSDEAVMRRALEQLKRQAEPYLNWAGKAERTSFEVDTVSLHVHERIDPATILAAIRKRMTKSGGEKVLQEEMFQAWFERPLPYREAVEFYKHDRGWSNRLISGDSLLVMNSLLQKEGMAGQVQMVYLDPPYGIKYGSNFQPFVNKREVKDRKDEDLTQEPEMIKAFRDTWELGIHSYLTYLRDRLLLENELLNESGSMFVQISDENLHLVRCILDEVLGPDHFIGLIAYSTTGGFASSTLSRTGDYVLWYAKNPSLLKFNRLFVEKNLLQEMDGSYDQVQLPSGRRRALNSDDKSAGATMLTDGVRVFTDGDTTAHGQTGPQSQGGAPRSTSAAGAGCLQPAGRGLAQSTGRMGSGGSRLATSAPDGLQPHRDSRAARALVQHRPGAMA